MIDELRLTLDRHAAQVTPRHDPYTRIIGLRRRRRTAAVLAASVALLVAAPAIWLLRISPATSEPAADSPPTAVIPLLNSPTRGSLAADQQYVARLRLMAVDREGGKTRLSDDPDLIRVLFVGDIGKRRIALVADMDATPQLVTFQGSPGDEPEKLVTTGSGELEPVVDADFALDSANPDQTYLLLGPTGAVYEKAETRYTGVGVQRTWSRVAHDRDYLGIADLDVRQRFRVRSGDMVLHEGEAGGALPANVPPVKVSVDPRPVAGRGRPMPEAAQHVADALANMTGLNGPEVTYRVLWSDEIDMPGTTTGRAAIATVQAVTADGGGPYTTGTIDTGDSAYRDHPTGYGIAGDLAHTLLAMRLPWYQTPSDRLQIIAPPSAVRAQVVRGTQTDEVVLVDGVGWLAVPAGSQVTIRAYDAGGVLLATLAYTDRDSFGCDRFDPTICMRPAIDLVATPSAMAR